MANLIAPQAMPDYPVFQPPGGLVAAVCVTLTVGTGDLDANAVHKFLKVPKGARFIGGHISFDALAASGLTVSVGDSVVVNRYANALTNGVAGTQAVLGRSPVSTLNVSAGTAVSDVYVYPAEDIIQITVAAAAVTPAAGNIRLVFQYVMAG